MDELQALPEQCSAIAFQGLMQILYRSIEIFHKH